MPGLDKQMKILLIMNPGIPVPPQLYGGIERIVYLLAEEYHKLGHEVTLLAGSGSHCSGTTVIIGNADRPLSKSKELFFVWRYLKNNHSQFDRIHNFGRLIYFLPIVHKPVYKIMSYQRQVSVRGIKTIVGLKPRNLVFTACSHYCVSTGNVAGRWEMVYNTIDFSTYQLNNAVADDAPLMFLGRLDKIKGAHTAIKVALDSGHTLLLAGNIPDTADNLQYYETEIKPLIDGKQIIYVGALNDIEKNFYLRQVKALLFPIEWDEPFGIVMIEAMACGTPVIAFNRGAVPEVVQQDVSGFIVNDIHEMHHAVKRVHQIDRQRCRENARSRFDISIITEQYLNL